MLADQEFRIPARYQRKEEDGIGAFMDVQAVSREQNFRNGRSGRQFSQNQVHIIAGNETAAHKYVIYR
ncbi:hypothetical protein D9M68_1006160 [compost metagenome]